MLQPSCKICGMNHRLGGCPLYQEPPALRPPSRRDAPVATAPQILHIATGEPRLTVGMPNEKPEDHHREAIEETERQKPAVVAQQKDGGALAQPEAGRPYSPDDMKQESLAPRQFFERPRFDKRKYMRELMRVRRARAEVAKNTPGLQ